MATQRSALRLVRLPLRSWATQPDKTSGIGRAYASFDERERGEERVHFRKEDERLLRDLLTKVKKQAAVDDKSATDDSDALDAKAIRAILSKYSISDDEVKALIAWKHA